MTAFGLGVWQWRRRTWKLNLIQDLENKASAPPSSLPTSQADIEALEYCKVVVRGHFEHGHEVYIGPRSDFTQRSSSLAGNPNTVGYHVITPFKLEDSGQRILVNRGWVPKDKLSAQSRGEVLSSNIIDLIGVVRSTEPKSSFTPQNVETTDKWSSRDVEALSRKFNSLPIFLDADATSNVANGPKAAEMRMALRNDHMSYMLTWFSLCGVTSYIWIRQFLKTIKQK